MKQKISFLAAIFLFISAALLAQTKYYKIAEGKIIDAGAYDKMKAKQLEKFKSISAEVKIKETFKEEYRNNDSIVYSYKWDIKLGKSTEAESEKFEPEEYIDKEFTLPDLKALNNKKINSDSLKGKPTLINFWFTTCKPCIEEMPVLNKIKNRFKDSVNFIAINYESNKKVKEFLTKHKYNFVQIADAKKFTDSLKMYSFPINVFLDRNGKATRIENGIPYIIGENGKMKMGDGKDFIETLRQLLY